MIEFQWPKGYKRPEVITVRNRREMLAVGDALRLTVKPRDLGITTLPSDFPSKKRYRQMVSRYGNAIRKIADQVRRKGIILVPHPESSLARLDVKLHPGLYPSQEAAARTTKRHELIHTLRKHMPYETRAQRIREELAANVGSLLGRRGRQLGTPFHKRLGNVIRHSLSYWKLSSPILDLYFRSRSPEIQFQKLYQPPPQDEPPQTLPRFTRGQLVDYTVQEHAARRAGLHRDIRIGTPRHGLLSWATRSRLPEAGQRIPIHPQPVHPHSYLGWSGEIPSGYGAGRVRTQELGKALVTESTPEALHATLASRRGSHRLAFLRSRSGGSHLLVSGRVPQPPPTQKPPAKQIAAGQIKPTLQALEGTRVSVQPKIDGALVFISTKGNRPEVFSHRVSKVSGLHPVHTERVFRGRPTTAIPQEHQRTLIGELYGVRKGKAIEPQALGGILNSHIAESLSKQQKAGVKLRIMPFDVVNGKEPYPERLAKVKQTLRYLPKSTFHAPEEATTTGAAMKLYQKVRAGRHPLTKEGVMIHPEHGKMLKVKNTEETDVKIHSIFPGSGKFRGSHGGFIYSDKHGKPLGRVGTGFTDETRRELHKYIGRTARVRYQERFPSGRLRAPSFIAIHESKQ